MQIPLRLKYLYPHQNQRHQLPRRLTIPLQQDPYSHRFLQLQKEATQSWMFHRHYHHHCLPRFLQHQW